MARVVKVDNAVLKRIAQKQLREKRSYRIKQVRKRFLIVCEGEKTEPNYFKSFESILPKGIISLDIVGEGDNTLNIVNKTIELRDRESRTGVGYDECWAVFDKDSFPNDRFNNAIFLASANNIGCAYSNEAFELWYLLHFEYYQNGMSREVYSNLLSAHLGVRYMKNDEKVFGLLNELGNVELAIERAELLIKQAQGTSPALANPTTQVHLLVKKLRAFIME